MSKNRVYLLAGVGFIVAIIFWIISSAIMFRIGTFAGYQHSLETPLSQGESSTDSEETARSGRHFGPENGERGDRHFSFGHSSHEHSGPKLIFGLLRGGKNLVLLAVLFLLGKRYMDAQSGNTTTGNTSEPSIADLKKTA